MLDELYIGLKGYIMSEYILMNKKAELLQFSIVVYKLFQSYCHEIDRYIDITMLPPCFSLIHDRLDMCNYDKHK